MAKKKKGVADPSEALGAGVSFRRKRGDKYLTITAKCDHPVVRMKWSKPGTGKPVLMKPKNGYVTWKVPEWSNPESQLELMGIADGADFFHCLYIARRHYGKDFLEHFFCYTIGLSKYKSCAMSVSFYRIPGIQRRR